MMDVVLDRSVSPCTGAPVAGRESNHVDPEVVAPMNCYNSGECDNSLDYHFRTCLAFIPNAEIFLNNK
jgi:hypothetical protein